MIVRYFVLLLFAASLQGITLETRNFSDIVSLGDADSLYVFDIDNTLIIPQHHLGHTRWGWNEKARLIELQYTDNEAFVESNEMMKRVWRVADVAPVEPLIPEVVGQIREQGSSTIALSRCVPSRGFVMLDRLAEIGIDLSGLVSGCSEVVDGVHHRYGCLFLEGHPYKGPPLVQFLATLNPPPKHVVYIDDREREVRNVERALSDAGISCSSVWYRAGDLRYHLYRQDIADVQAKYFGRILPNEEAQLLLDAGLVGPPAEPVYTPQEESEWDIDQIEAIEPLIDGERMVVFHIENTLMETAHHLGSEQWASIHKPDDELWFGILSQSTMRLVDPAVQGLIRSLREAGIVVMGLSTKGREAHRLLMEGLRSVDVELDGLLYGGDLPDGAILISNSAELLTAYPHVTRFRLTCADQRVKSYKNELAEVQLRYFNRVLPDSAAEALKPRWLPRPF